MHRKFLSLDELRELEPELKDKSDAEVERIRQLTYELAAFALERYVKSKTGKDVTFGIPYFSEPDQALRPPKVTEFYADMERMRNRFANNLTRAIEQYLTDEKALFARMRAVGIDPKQEGLTKD